MFRCGTFCRGTICRKKKQPNLIWLNLTETNILFDSEVSHSEKSGHDCASFEVLIAL